MAISDSRKNFRLTPEGLILASQLDRDALTDCFRGALLGTMVGDAPGMLVEGMSNSAIRARYDLVTEMLPARLGRGTYTDDTEMMIGLAEGLLDTPGRLDAHKVAALWAVLSSPEDPEMAIIRAVNLGGDTDTIGAMAGAYHGAEALPKRWTQALEEGEKGKGYVLGLADRLHDIATGEP